MREKLPVLIGAGRRYALPVRGHLLAGFRLLLLSLLLLLLLLPRLVHVL